MPSNDTLIQQALRFSRYAQRLIQSDPEQLDMLHARLRKAWTAAEMQVALDGSAMNNEAELRKSLRKLRKQVMLRLIVRDLAGLADLNEVMATATALAEVTTRCAAGQLDGWLRMQYGDPIGNESGEHQVLIVAGMGKLGGGELNVSSDIDLIYLYPEDGETSGPKVISNHEYFTLLGRKLSSALSEVTEDGFVFRVDLRLRPYGESGPLVTSFAMLENYLVTQGREWERYAWIKGRVVCGGHEAGLAQLVRPFVFRKYLDFGTFASMRDLHVQIRQEVQRRELSDNIKLGPGGIREIEFIAQVFQLIRGGKLAKLQTRSTLAALPLLSELNLLPQETVTELHAAYVFLRNLEHRLQYLDDQQTQRLPQNDSDRELIAQAMMFENYTEFLHALDAHRSKVTRHFEQIFAAPQSSQESHPLSALWNATISGEDAVTRLEKLGYQHPQLTWEHLQRIKTGARYNQMPAASRSRFDALIAPLIETSASFANADQTLERVLQLMESICRREAYLALLLEYPQTLVQVTRICSASPWAADYLSQHPILLDELLDARRLLGKPDWQARILELEERLAETANDVERQMDTLRHFKHTQVFHLLAQDLAGLLPLEILSDQLSALADLILGQTLRLCWEGLKQKHRETPQFAIIGYGKLGGKELGYASDLDIIFLYDDAAPEAAEIYAKLAQRINTWLTTLTPAGVLYETDLRLRPDGASGLLVSTVAAFETYQKTKAWVWEHQALTRARRVAGDEKIGETFERIRQEVLTQSRDTAQLRTDVMQMRQKMLAAHPNNSTLFDIKHDRGGIIDVEFIVQYLVLAGSHAHPELTRNSGNLALLKLASELNLIPENLAQKVKAAYRQYRLWQHQLRLQGAQYARIETTQAQPYVDAVLELWNIVFGNG